MIVLLPKDEANIANKADGGDVNIKPEANDEPEKCIGKDTHTTAQECHTRLRNQARSSL